MKVVVLLIVALAIGCSRQPETASSAPASAAPKAPEAPKAPQAPKAPRIVFLGDSLTAGLGLAPDRSFPSLIEKKLQEKGLDYEVVNAGVSGDTSAGGVRRLEWSLDGDVRVLILALGANDGLRGLSTKEMNKNLAAVLERARDRKVPVILAGMEAPPNYGPEYTRDFRNVFAELATEYKVRFIPFLLLGVAGDSALNQPDGIHPNIRGAEIVADLVWKELEPMVRRPN